MAFLKNLVVEFVIVVRYSIFPTVISLLLSFIDWHYGIILSFVKLFVFLRLVHNEDRRTPGLPFKYIFVKLFAAISIFYLTAYSAEYLEERFLPSGIYPTAPTDSDGSTYTVKVPKSKAKRILQSQRDDGGGVKAAHAIIKIFVHYLYIANSLAQHRWSFLALIIIIFGLIHLILMYYMPQKKARSASSRSNTSMKTLRDGDDDDSDEDDG